MKIYSFTGGRPSPEDFPIQGLIDATQRMLRRRGTDLIAYPDMNGQHDELAEIVAIRFENRECKPHRYGKITGTIRAKWCYIYLRQGIPL